MYRGYYTYVELWGQFLLKRKYIKRVELTKTNILVEAPNDHITGPSFWGSLFVCLNPFWFEWIEGVLLKVFRFPCFSSPCPFNDVQGQLLPYPLISDRWMLQCFRVGFLWTKKYFKIQSVLSRLNSLIPDGINKQTNFLLKKRTPLSLYREKSFHCKTMYRLVFKECF